MRISIDAYSANLPKIQIRVSWYIKNDGCLLMPIPELFEMLQVAEACDGEGIRHELRRVVPEYHQQG